ncbi:MAG: protein kinase [Deltaproteobacteria bacterium]|nr:protein kinase [Deltaproteobacteria bacterium]
MTSTHAQTRVDTLPACGLGLAGIPLPVERDRSLPLPSSPPPAPPAFDEPEVGSRVGRYVLEQRIGEGGMGVVWRAYDVEIGRRVALKFVRTTPTGVDAKLWSRLRREAQALAKIRHDGVVSLFDMGHDGHGAYLALEYVPGMHLRRWLRQGTRSPRQILRVIAQAARGLAAVHRAGLVHRDVKPTNLLVARDGRVVWVDFGLALGVADLSRSRTDSIDDAPLRTRLTRANMIVGTTHYMSPEQLLGRDLMDAAISSRCASPPSRRCSARGHSRRNPPTTWRSPTTPGPARCCPRGLVCPGARRGHCCVGCRSTPRSASARWMRSPTRSIPVTPSTPSCAPTRARAPTCRAAAGTVRSPAASRPRGGGRPRSGPPSRSRARRVRGGCAAGSRPPTAPPPSLDAAGCGGCGGRRLRSACPNPPRRPDRGRHPRTTAHLQTRHHGSAGPGPWHGCHPRTPPLDLPELQPEERAMLQRFRVASSPDGATQARVLAAVHLRIAPAPPAADDGRVLQSMRPAGLSQVLPWLRAGGLAVAIAAATLLVIGGTTRVVMAVRSEAPATTQAMDRAEPSEPLPLRSPAVDPTPSLGIAPPPVAAELAAPPEESAVVADVDARVPDAARPRPRTNRGTQGPREAVASPIDAAAEIALVQAAKREHDAAQRLALLERHHREFARGVLTQEVAILEIQTLCALGRREQASAHAEGFLRRWPGSAYGAAASRGCDAKAGRE